MKTNAAMVAKEIKTYLKKEGIASKVRSENYSGGDSVRVVVFNQPPEIIKKIEEHTNKYEYGHFDGMQDIYEYSNTRNDIPQTKFLFIENSFSDEMRQKAWSFIRGYCSGADSYPEDLQSVPTTARIWEDWASNLVYRLLNGSLNMSDGANKFWSTLA